MGLICLEGQRIHLFSGHIFNITVDFAASLYECTEMACKKCITTDIVEAVGTGDIPRGLLGDAAHWGPQLAGPTGLWLHF